jgi:hypothetical protein
LVGIVEFLGWFGAVTVLAGYLLFSLGKIPNGPLYQVLNLVGGLSVAINVAAHHAIPSTIVNGVWAVIAVVVLVKMARARRLTREGATQVPAAAEHVVLHTEPPATTAVLPVVGPALRDHEAEVTDIAGSAPRLQAVTDTDAVAAPAAPMTESVPVITATIALALVAAAQQHAEHGTQEHPEPTPEREDAAQR